MNVVNKVLWIKYKEDKLLFWNILEIGCIVVAFVIHDGSFGLAILISCHMFDAYFTTSLNKKYGLDELLGGNVDYHIRRNRLLLGSALISNMPLGIVTFIYICSINRSMKFICVLYTLVILLVANAIASIVGIMVKTQVCGLFICTVIAVIQFIKLLVLEEYFRYFSLVVQIGNMRVIQWWNLLVLFLIAVTIYILLIYRKKIQLVLGSAFIIIIILLDITGDHGTLSEQYVKDCSETLHVVNRMNQLHGFPYFDDLIIYKSVYYPWQSSDRKQIITLQENSLYVNCFTESLCNMKQDELINRAIVSLLKPRTQVQYNMIELYIQKILGNDLYVNSFLYDEQMKEYGLIVSKYYGFYAEVLTNNPQRFGELYELSKTCDSPEKLQMEWK